MLAALDLALVRDFGTALLIGGLLGIEREKRNTRAGFGHAGLRSFVMLSQIGAIGGFFADKMQTPWVLVAAVLAATAIVVSGYFAALRQHPEASGLTTELAAVAACLFGALATSGHRELAIGLGVITAAMLAYKQPLHALVGSIGWEDVLVGMRLLLATFIVLPLLPNETIDPWGAINPYKLWILVLLISGLSLAGYVASRWLGTGRGVAVTAASGGLVSSTATTLTFVKQSHESGAPPRQLAGGILLAWTVMFVRVVVAAAIVAPVLIGALAVPFAAMGLASGVSALVCLWTRKQANATVAATVPMKNPFSLWAASKFAALFAVVQLLLAMAQEYLPRSGVYPIAALAGLTDVDAITLSMAQRAKEAPPELALQEVHIAVVAIVVAAFSNTMTKAAMALMMGRGLARPVLIGTAAIVAAGAVGLAFS